MKINAIIIEDELLARERLKTLLEKHKDIIEISAETNNGQAGLAAIKELKPDLIFLDIQMPGLNGFQMLQKLEELPMVIFTTAYDEFALQAFDNNAIDYLLKPIGQDRLDKAIDKLLKLKGDTTGLYDSLMNFINKINQPNTDYIKVKTGSITKLVRYQTIYYFKSESKYTYLYTKNNRYILTESLNELEKELPPNFKRIHRSVIINIDHLKEIIQLSANKTIVIMNDINQTELPVSRRMKSIL